jgi:tetratricopeptide (TPR) repeat protein
MALAEPTEQDIAAAIEIFNKAEKHYALQEYEEALGSYKEAYRLSEKHELLFNIGQCYRQLKRYDEAIKSYQSFLRLGGEQDVEGRERAESRIKELEELKKSQPTDLPPVDTREPNRSIPVVLAGVGAAGVLLAGGLEVRRQIGNAPQIVRARGYFAAVGVASLGVSVALFVKNKKAENVSVSTSGNDVILTFSF